MLDGFEARLADLVADELNGIAAIEVVTRPRSDLTTAPDRVALVVRTLSATPDVTMGDDARERLGTRGSYRLRTMLRLTGQVAIDAVVSPTGGADLEDRRPIVMTVVDRLLVAFQRASIRSGRDFQTDVDLGFDLDGFRFAGVAAPSEAPASFSTIRAIYDFTGRFWPIEAPVEGDAIAALPTRLAVLPVRIPERIQARAGQDLTIPLHIDLRALNGAAARVMARLRGASPPGQLIGSGADVPAGWFAFTPDPEGAVALVYRPPAAVPTPVRVGVSTALSRAERPLVPLAELDIEVTS
jgi:hypothetical protein